MTHRQVADKAGITSTSLSRILSWDHMNPRFDTIVRLANVLGENVGWLLDERGFFLSGAESSRLDDALRTVEAFVARATAAVRTPRRRSPPNIVRSSRAIPDAFRARGVQQAWTVVGDSMIAVGITDGDDLFVRPTTDLREGEGRIVICRVVANEYVGELVIRNDRLILLSGNDLHPMVEVVHPDDFALLGVVVGRSDRVFS